MVGFSKKAAVKASTTVKAPEEKKPVALPAIVPVVLPTDPTPTAVVSTDGDALAEHARKLGAEESEEMQSTFETVAKGRDDWQGGPIMCLLALRRAYTPEQLAEFAIPDSDTGNNPDRFDVEYMDGDTKRKKKSNFYKEFAHGTVTGKTLNERLEFLSRAADKGSVKDGIPEDILDMSVEARISHTSFCAGRLSTMTQAYKKAMRLYFKFQEVEEYAPECSAYPMFIEGHEPEMDDQTTGTTVERDISDVMLERTNEPIAVTWNMGEGKPVKWEPFTVGAFLKLNPAKAIEKGGGFKHLVDSGATKKAPKTPGKAEKPEGLTIKTTDTGLGVVAELHRYMAEILSAKDKAEYGKLAQALMAKDTDETCTAMVELKNWLNDLCRDCKLDGRYVKLKQSGSDLIQDAA